MIFLYISLSAFSKPIHPETSTVLLCTFHYLFSFFTLTHLSFIPFLKHPDINECLSAHACELNERCVNTAGSYVCQRLITCPPGHQINNDVCEGTPLLISIKVFPSTHSECAVNTSRRAFVLLHVHNVRKAHCSSKQSLLLPL